MPPGTQEDSECFQVSVCDFFMNATPAASDLSLSDISDAAEQVGKRAFAEVSPALSPKPVLDVPVAFGRGCMGAGLSCWRGHFETGVLSSSDSSLDNAESTGLHWV